MQKGDKTTNQYGERTSKYAIGHQFISRSNRTRGTIETVVDVYITRNRVGEIIRMEYLVAHDFIGQSLTQTVIEVTISLGETILEKLEATNV